MRILTILLILSAIECWDLFNVKALHGSEDNLMIKRRLRIYKLIKKGQKDQKRVRRVVCFLETIREMEKLSEFDLANFDKFDENEKEKRMKMIQLALFNICWKKSSYHTIYGYVDYEERERISHLKIGYGKQLELAPYYSQ